MSRRHFSFEGFIQNNSIIFDGENGSTWQHLLQHIESFLELLKRKGVHAHIFCSRLQVFLCQRRKKNFSLISSLLYKLPYCSYLMSSVLYTHKSFCLSWWGLFFSWQFAKKKIPTTNIVCEWRGCCIGSRKKTHISHHHFCVQKSSGV